MSEWRPIETAPKDRATLLVWHDHDSDPYWDERPYKCTPYGAWAEGNGYEKTPGLYLAVWGGGYWDDESGEGWGPVTQMPDWWFKHDSEYEQPLAPTHWMPLPEPPNA